MVRVVLLPKDAGEVSAGESQITIDMLVDGSGSAVGPFPAFGRVGDFRKPGTLYPFTLMGDGRMDYGAHADEAARQDKLSIRATNLTLGAEVACTAGDRVTVFVIDTVTSLAPA
jgi:hypothetical protein